MILESCSISPLWSYLTLLCRGVWNSKEFISFWTPIESSELLLSSFLFYIAPTTGIKRLGCYEGGFLIRASDISRSKFNSLVWSFWTNLLTLSSSISSMLFRASEKFPNKVPSVGRKPLDLLLSFIVLDLFVDSEAFDGVMRCGAIGWLFSSIFNVDLKLWF